jgi:hypothetical protein
VSAPLLREFGRVDYAPTFAAMQEFTAKALRLMPNWLYDRLFTSAPRKPRGLIKSGG